MEFSERTDQQRREGLRTYRDGAAQVASQRALLTAGGSLAPVGGQVLRLLFAALDRAAAVPCRGRCRACIHVAGVADLTLHAARLVTVTTRRKREQRGWEGAGLGKRAGKVLVLQVCRVQIRERRGQARAGRERVRVTPGSAHTHRCPRPRQAPPTRTSSPSSGSAHMHRCPRPRQTPPTPAQPSITLTSDAPPPRSALSTLPST